jgi:SAM-dependent methyltransferase
VTAEDAWMRLVLHDRYRALFRPGERVLDLGCGTGLDTLFLAALGLRVTALDVSPGMIEALGAKLGPAGLAETVEARVGEAAGLEGWPPEAFDGVVSAFAVLNTLPDLAGAARGIARVLRPGGRAVLHLLGRPGAWERLALAARLRFREAGRLGERRWLEAVVGGVPVRHRLYRAEEAASLTAPPLRLRAAYALGFLWPRRAGRAIPVPVAHALGRLEARLGRRRPWIHLGRFVVLELERPPAA